MNLVTLLLFDLTCKLFVESYKKKCITAALFAKKNREECEVYKTAIIYTRLHFEKIKKIKYLHKNILKEKKVA